MGRANGKIFFFIVFLACSAAVLFWVFGSFPGGQRGAGEKQKRAGAAPVEVAGIEHGPIELHRTFSGALEPRAEFVVAPKVSGRLERLTVNLADIVGRGELVGELDNDEYVQAVAQARADLAVTRANLAAARSAMETANRERDRITTLRRRGVASEVQLDTASANQLAKKVEFEVAEANVLRAESSLETANIRLGYTRINAGWSGGADQRVVAERYVDEGEMVSANTPLLRIVELDPITGVIFVTERDYARLHFGQEVLLVTDAFPGEKFQGHIARIAPVFKQTTRQARVELTIDNDRQRLKPGMFIRAAVVLDRDENATIVPLEALTKRDDRTGIFLVAQDGRKVSWRLVETGIRDGNSVQILGERLSGRVVTLGQQLLSDGSTIVIADEQSTPTQPVHEGAP
jgi:RND family efflux transporter MFP subunit